MNKLAKLLQKITKKERQAIKSLIVLLKRKQFTGLDIVKIKSSDYDIGRKVLKDGDLAEVDADNGIVRIV